jgi:arylsulfatase A-like enzyme
MRSTVFFLGVVFFAGCTGNKDAPSDTDSGPTPGTSDTKTGPTTDTLPSFYGSAPKNLLVISIDTFRRDHLGKYSDLGLTPFMGKLMDEGYTLDNHMTCSDWTFAGTACTMNGELNEENGFQPELGGLHMLMPTRPQLATWLHDDGFYSIQVSGNSWFSSAWNMTQGFDETQLTGGAATSIYEVGQGLLLDAIARGAVTDRWYLHVHLMEPHAPYSPPEEYLGCEASLPPLPGGLADLDLATKDAHYEATAAYPALSAGDEAILKEHFDCRYNGELQSLDDRLSQVWTELEQNHLLDDTLVVFWNDHGEQIWDHGFESHAHQLYAEENNGFMFFWAKNIVPGSTDLPTSSIDLVPTLLALYGDTNMPAQTTGLPLGTSTPDRVRYALTSARNGTISTVRSGDYKEIFNWVSGTVELYDDATDPTEQTNLYDPADAKTLELWSLLAPEIELAVPSILDDQPRWPAALPPPP